MRFFLFAMVSILCCISLACDSKDEVAQLKVLVPSELTVPEDMVYIPAGDFIMGDPSDSRTLKGKTLHTEAFLIDRYETSRGKYASFKSDYSFDPSKKDFPVANIDYASAEAYCRFKGGRLPTEVEWEKSARGVDDRKWPWRNFYQHPNNGFSGFLPEPVDKRSEWISPYGIYGMGHNVWEWTSDDYSYPGQAHAERGKFKVIRGGLTQTHTTIKFTPVFFRNWMEPTASHPFLGFRCARSIHSVD